MLLDVARPESPTSSSNIGNTSGIFGLSHRESVPLKTNLNQFTDIEGYPFLRNGPRGQLTGN